MWYVYTMQNYSAIEKEQDNAFAATQMDLEIIILSEVREESHMILCVKSLKNDTNELIYKTEIDIQTQKTNYGY